MNGMEMRAENAQVISATDEALTQIRTRHADIMQDVRFEKGSTECILRVYPARRDKIITGVVLEILYGYGYMLVSVNLKRGGYILLLKKA